VVVNCFCVKNAGVSLFILIFPEAFENFFNYYQLWSLKFPTIPNFLPETTPKIENQKHFLEYHMCTFAKRLKIKTFHKFIIYQ